MRHPTILFFALLAACSSQVAPDPSDPAPGGAADAASVLAADVDNESEEESESMNEPAELEVATFGAGCFWCVEAVLEQVDGVESVASGYMGGHVDNPTYEQVCSGTSGHVEVAQVRFDPERISYPALVAWFWNLHDPTQVDRQGNDVGPQYASVIFTHSDRQRQQAEESKAKLEASGKHLAGIATRIEEASTFYPAEDYHQDYYRQNKSQGYCRYVIAPKLDKLGLEK